MKKIKIQREYLNFKGWSKDKLNLGEGCTWISYSNRKYTELGKIEKRLQCRNNGTVWSIVKSINWGLRLEVFNKEVIEKRVNLEGLIDLWFTFNCFFHKYHYIQYIFHIATVHHRKNKMVNGYILHSFFISVVLFWLSLVIFLISALWLLYA